MPSLQHFLLGVFLLLLFTAPGHQASADQDPELQRILKAHVDAMGGWRAWNKVESIRLTGTIEREGETYDFCIIKKRPDQIRVTLTFDIEGTQGEKAQAIQSSDGKNGWKATRLAGDQKIEKIALNEAETEQLVSDSNIEPKLINFMLRGYKITLDETTEDIVILTVRDKDRTDSKNWRFGLDKSTYKVANYEVFYGEVLHSKTTFNDNELVDGIYYPKTICVTSVKTGDSVMQISEIYSGVGIYEDYFKNQKLETE